MSRWRWRKAAQRMSSYPTPGNSHAQLTHRVTVVAVVLLAVASLVTGLPWITFATNGSATAAQHTQAQRGSTPGQLVLTSYSSLTTPRVTSYRVAPGDTLTSISQRLYGQATCWPGIYNQNRKAIGGNPGLIKTGEVLAIPAACTVKPPALIAVTAVVTASPPRSTLDATQAQPLAAGSVQAAAQAIFGSQYSCAAWIIVRESGWNTYATNPYSGAYGIPQALPGSKMASAGADWQTNPVTQLRWMASYVSSSYGGACGAQAFWEAHGAY